MHRFNDLYPTVTKASSAQVNEVIVFFIRKSMLSINASPLISEEIFA